MNLHRTEAAWIDKHRESAANNQGGSTDVIRYSTSMSMSKLVVGKSKAIQAQLQEEAGRAVAWHPAKSLCILNSFNLLQMCQFPPSSHGLWWGEFQDFISLPRLPPAPPSNLILKERWLKTCTQKVQTASVPICLFITVVHYFIGRVVRKVLFQLLHQ